MRFVAAVSYTYVCVKSLIVSDLQFVNERKERKEEEEKKMKTKKNQTYLAARACVYMCVCMCVTRIHTSFSRRESNVGCFDVNERTNDLGT